MSCRIGRWCFRGVGVNALWDGALLRETKGLAVDEGVCFSAIAVVQPLKPERQLADSLVTIKAGVTQYSPLPGMM